MVADAETLARTVAEQLLDRLSAAREAAPRSALSIGRTAHWIMRARYGLFNPIVRALRRRRGVGREAGPR